MKKMMMGLLALVLVLGFVACSETITVDETTEEIGTVVEYNEETDVFAVEALTATTLLDYSQFSTLSVDMLSETTDEELIDEEVDEIDQYLEMMESFLGDNNGLTITELVSDRTEYQFLISFTTVNMLGDEVVYYLYFNETVYEEVIDDEETTTEEEVTTEAETTTEEEVTTEEVTTEAETTEPLSSTDQAFNFDDEDDEFVVYAIEGLLVYNETEYNLEGKKVIDEDLNEIVRLRAFVDSDNFVKVTYKTDSEDGNQKFFFEVKEDGVVINKSRVMVVEEEGNIVVHLTFVDETGTYKYKFSILEEEGVTLIHIKYDFKLEDGTKESGNVHIEVTLDTETGETVYTYKILAKGGVGNGNQYRKEIETRRNNQGQGQANSNKQNA